MNNKMLLFRRKVAEEWVDYNNHMNDAEYARVFSWSVDHFMSKIGISKQFINKSHYTIYTLESHICFLDEVKLNENIEVYAQIIDYDQKRIHLFMELYSEGEKRAATSEQMLIGIDQNAGKSAEFPKEIMEKISEVFREQSDLPKPKEVGRVR